MDSIHILPGLTGSAQHVWRRGHSYTVKVTDAGAPVSGALVRFAGHQAKTNRHGMARFTVSRHQALKRSTVTVSHRGYAGVAVRCRSSADRVTYLDSFLQFGAAAVARGEDTLTRLDIVRISDRILRSAGTMLPTQLRSLDAIHIATATALGADLAPL